MESENSLLQEEKGMIMRENTSNRATLEAKIRRYIIQIQTEWQKYDIYLKTMSESEMTLSKQGLRLRVSSRRQLWKQGRPPRRSWRPS